MAEWKVELVQIELLPHPNAEKLDLAKVGERQYVVQKGLYKDGDFVISVPEKSILPDNIADDGYRDYLRGKAKNRVGSVKLRGEISEGVLLNPDKWLGKDANNPDFDFSPEGLATYLGITQYEPPIPAELRGRVGNMTYKGFVGHDCDQFSILVDKTFSLGENIVVTEKIHGTQINILIELQNGEVTNLEVASKGLGKKGIVLDNGEDNEYNFYWRALNNTDIVRLVQKNFYHGANPMTVQVVGEAVPIQPGFDYGFSKPTVLIYRIIVNGKTLAMNNIPPDFDQYWVPIIWYAQYDDKAASVIRGLAQGNSKLSDHIKEGVVVTSSDHPGVYLKFISDAYAKKATGEEIN